MHDKSHQFNVKEQFHIYEFVYNDLGPLLKYTLLNNIICLYFISDYKIVPQKCYAYDGGIAVRSQTDKKVLLWSYDE